MYKGNFHSNLQTLFKAAFFTTFSVLWIYDTIIILVMLKYLVIWALHSSQKETPATVAYTISTIMIMTTNFKTIADLTIHVASLSQTCYNLPIMSWKGNTQLWFIVGRVMEYLCIKVRIVYTAVHSILLSIDCSIASAVQERSVGVHCVLHALQLHCTGCFVLNK